MYVWYVYVYTYRSQCPVAPTVQVLLCKSHQILSVENFCVWSFLPNKALSLSRSLSLPPYPHPHPVPTFFPSPLSLSLPSSLPLPLFLSPFLLVEISYLRTASEMSAAPAAVSPQAFRRKAVRQLLEASACLTF